MTRTLPLWLVLLGAALLGCTDPNTDDTDNPEGDTDADADTDTDTDVDCVGVAFDIALPDVFTPTESKAGTSIDTEAIVTVSTCDDEDNCSIVATYCDGSYLGESCNVPLPDDPCYTFVGSDGLTYLKASPESTWKVGLEISGHEVTFYSPTFQAPADGVRTFAVTWASNQYHWAMAEGTYENQWGDEFDDVNLHFVDGVATLEIGGFSASCEEGDFCVDTEDTRGSLESEFSNSLEDMTFRTFREDGSLMDDFTLHHTSN